MSRRLLFLSERYPPDWGGVAASAGRIARALAWMGHEVDVVTWTRMLEPGRVVREEGAPPVYRMGRFRGWDMTMPHTQILLEWLAGAESYDAVWGHYLFPGGFLAAWFGRLHGIPSLVSVRGNDIDREMFPPGDFARLQWTLREARLVTAVTRDLARKAGALAGRDDVACLHNAVDTEVFAPGPCADRVKLGIRPDEAVLGFAGELREKKGQRHLLEALRQVQASRPACLLIIGEVRPSEAPQWNAEEQRILITGHLKEPAEVNAHLQLCDVYLQPSLWDGMPNALLEAMAAGCGCIGSDAGGIPEVITPGVNGIVLPRWQLHRLGEAILEWLDAAPEHRERIRQAGRAHMLAEFSLEGERRQLQALLDRLMPSSW
jgi:glycosyltransferase involved in cell wall biosynthesis